MVHIGSPRSTLEQGGTSSHAHFFSGGLQWCRNLLHHVSYTMLNVG